MSPRFKLFLLSCLSIFVECPQGPPEENQIQVPFIPVLLPRLPAIPQLQNLTFDVNGTVFRLALRPEWSVVTIDTEVTIIRPEGARRLDGSRLSRWYYGGTVNDDENSTVYGTLEKGVFDGYFRLHNVTYFLEPYRKYFRNPAKLYNAVAYIATDRRNACFAYENQCDGHGRLVEQPVTPQPTIVTRSNLKSTNVTEPGPTPTPKTSLELEPLVCTIKIVGDFRFVSAIGDEKRALDVVQRTTSMADATFRKMDFDGDGRPEGIGFRVTAIELHVDPEHHNATDGATWNPVAFFEEMQRYDFGNACAGLLFTHRPMGPEVAGSGPSLPKISATNGTARICSTMRPSVPKGPEDDYGRYFSNALPVNFRLQNGTADDNAIVVQLLHQLGHLFGALGDDGSSDQHPFATSFPPPSGRHPNHFLLSPRAKRNVWAALQSGRKSCLERCRGSDACPASFGLPLPLKASRKGRKPATRTYTEKCATIPRTAAAQRLYPSCIESVPVVALLLISMAGWPFSWP